MSSPSPKPASPLAKWMAENEKTDAEVAVALKLDRAQVNRLRRAISIPSLGTAKLLEQLTGVDAMVHMEVERAQRAAA